MDAKIASRKTDHSSGEKYFESELRYLMFSGHDDNVFPFMRQFKLTSPACLQ